MDRDSLDQRILTAQLALMCKLTKLPLFGSIFIGAIIAYVAAKDSSLYAGIWYTAAIVIMLIRWTIADAFLQNTHDFASVRRWQAAMLVLIALFGMIWSIPQAFLLPKNPQREIVMSVMFIGATATGIGSLSTVRHAYATLLIPMMLPYMVSQLLMGGDRMLIGVAVVLYLPVMIAIANRQTNSITRQIRLALENEALVAELRQERDRVNEINRNLQIEAEQHRLSIERVRNLNRDLELQASELRAANNDLEGFSYSVSHDLRGPLRAIDGFSSLLEGQRFVHDSHESEHYLHRIRENIARMSMLIDDLLAFSRCARQPVDMRELDMDDLVHTAVKEVCANRNAPTPPEIAVEALPQARGDQQLMLQVWINLIDNAVKYSSKVEHPKIIVRGHEEDDRIVYEVVDNGIGFDNRYSDRLFGVFQRLHAQREFPGSGVGLAIVQRIVTRHGGEVQARSELNHGATFGFAVPKSARHVEPPTVPSGRHLPS